MGSCVCRPRSMRCIWGLRSPRAVPGLVRRFVLSCCALPWPTVPRVCMEEIRCSVQDTGRNSTVWQRSSLLLHVTAALMKNSDRRHCVWISNRRPNTSNSQRLPAVAVKRQN